MALCWSVIWIPVYVLLPSFKNERSLRKVKERNSVLSCDGLRECDQSQLKRYQEEFSRSLGVRQNICIPNAAVDRYRLLSYPGRGAESVREAGFISSPGWHKALILPSAQRMLVEFLPQLGARFELAREFSDKILWHAKHCNSRTLSNVVPFEGRFCDIVSLCWWRIGNNPRPIGGDGGIGTFGDLRGLLVELPYGKSCETSRNDCGNQSAHLKYQAVALPLVLDWALLLFGGVVVACGWYKGNLGSAWWFLLVLGGAALIVYAEKRLVDSIKISQNLSHQAFGFIVHNSHIIQQIKSLTDHIC